MRKLLFVVLLLAVHVIGLQAQDTTPESTPDAAAETTGGTPPAALCEQALPAAEPETRTYEAPEQVLEAGVDYRAIFCTDAGPVYIDLFEDAVPNTVNNFVFLAQNGYYNNTVFHRVLQDFMAQGGDPTGTGMGGPGYQFEDEYPWFIQFDRPGLLAMANAGPATNGSQFFITTVPTPHLNFQFDPQRGGLVGHTIFGAVLEGQENVEGFTLIDPSSPGGETPTQLQTVLIITEPETVETTFVAPEAADPQLIITRLQELAETAAETPEVVITVSDHLLTLEEVAATLPEAVQSDASAALESHNFEVGASVAVNNQECNLQFNFLNTGYELYGFASKEDATAALNEGVFQSIAEADGFTLSEETAMSAPLYTQDVQTCDIAARTGRIYVQRGRYIAQMEVTIPADAQFDLHAALQRLTSNIFEATLSEVLVLELSQ